MKIFCHYHPTQSAHWTCDGCNLTICSSCAIRDDSDKQLNEKNRFICPQCKIEVQWLGAAHLIEPFWNRLPKFFSYPISIQTLILITALSLSSLIFTGPGLFSLLIGYLIWGLLIKYSYEALKATAQGNLKPPRINAQTISEDFHQVFKQLVLFFLIGFVFAWLSPRIGIFASGVFLIVVVLSVPAMIILLVTTNSLMHALNPLIFTRLIIRIGWGYILMFFFLALLGGAPVYLSAFIGDFMPVGLHQFLFAFAQNFYTVISYHLMGYVILQYHQQIGYQVGPEYFEHDSQTDRAMPIDDDARTLKEVKLLVQTGQLDKAISFIKEATKENGIQNIILSERYYNLLKMRKCKLELVAHGATHLRLLVEHNQKAKAYKVYYQCQALDPNFTPSPAALFKLGGWLNETGKVKESIAVFNRLVKAYPQNKLAPKAYFRAAQVINDRLMRPDRAKQILTGLIQRYPDHEVISQVKTYLGHI